MSNEILPRRTRVQAEDASSSAESNASQRVILPVKTAVRTWHLGHRPRNCGAEDRWCTHLLCGCADIDIVNRVIFALRLNSRAGETAVRGDIHAGENNPVFMPIRAHEVMRNVRIEKGQQPSAQILETRQANISRRHVMVPTSANIRSSHSRVAGTCATKWRFPSAARPVNGGIGQSQGATCRIAVAAMG